MNEDEDYFAWLQHRRAVQPAGDLADRIMSEVETTLGEIPNDAGPALRRPGRIGPILLVTAASLVFVARIAALVGDLVFPNGYSEFALNQRIEEVPDEQRIDSRS